MQFFETHFEVEALLNMRQGCHRSLREELIDLAWDRLHQTIKDEHRHCDWVSKVYFGSELRFIEVSFFCDEHEEEDHE